MSTFSSQDAEACLELCSRGHREPARSYLQANHLFACIFVSLEARPTEAYERNPLLGTCFCALILRTNPYEKNLVIVVNVFATST